MRSSLLLTLLTLTACKTTDTHLHHAFDDADAWAKRFEDPSRDAWQRPDDVIAALALAKDAKVCDIGSATGYFPVRLAKVVTEGHVYGADVENSMVEYLNRRAATEGLGNLTSHHAEFSDPKIPEPVDLVMMVNTYHHIEERTAYFTNVARSIAPGGRLVIIDFTRTSTMGPPAEAKVPREDVEKELAAAGYTLIKAHDFLPEQFFLEFRAPTPKPTR
jgi:cyclopropane fatty-acyl-phospholipid synthase-like methyltransferase